MSVTMSVVSRTFFGRYFRAGMLVSPPQPSFLEDALVALSFLKDVFTRSERPVERPFLSAPGQVVELPSGSHSLCWGCRTFQLFILEVAARSLHSAFFSERVF